MLLEKFCRIDYDSYEDFYENFHINVPDNFNFGFDVVDALAAEKPDARALVWCNNKGESRTFTFSDISRLSNQAANMFRAHGLRKGDIVMTTLRNRYEYWIVAVALHKLGAVLLPATHQLTKKDFAYRFEAAGVKAIVTDGEPRLVQCIDEASEYNSLLKLKYIVEGEHEGYIDFDAAIADESDEFPRPTGEAGTTNDDLFLMYFTSGTTGLPKIAMHDYRYPLGHILTARFWQDLRPGDLHFTTADTGWAKTSWGKIYGQWLSEATVFVYDYDSKFNPTDYLRVIEQYKVNIFCAPPTVFRFLIKADIAHYDLSSLRHCCIAGEPLNAEVYNKWKQITGLELREGFGQSETAVLVATYPWIDAKPRNTGRPSPHFCAKLLDRDGNAVDPGEAGELCIPVHNGHPAGLTLGYYKDKKNTDAVLHDGWYHTGDMAWADSDGYWWFVGRSDDVIKCSGYRIGPFEVESALLEHPAVMETAITAVPDPTRGQIVKATIILANGFQPSDALKTELQTHVKSVTAPYKYPRIIEFVDEIPKTISGKIKRAELRHRDSLRFDS